MARTVPDRNGNDALAEHGRELFHATGHEHPPWFLAGKLLCDDVKALTGALLWDDALVLRFAEGMLLRLDGSRRFAPRPRGDAEALSSTRGTRQRLEVCIQLPQRTLPCGLNKSQISATRHLTLLQPSRPPSDLPVWTREIGDKLRGLTGQHFLQHQLQPRAGIRLPRWPFPFIVPVPTPHAEWPSNPILDVHVVLPPPAPVALRPT